MYENTHVAHCDVAVPWTIEVEAWVWAILHRYVVPACKKKLEIIVVGTEVAVLLGERRSSPAWHGLYSEHFAFSQ